MSWSANGASGPPPDPRSMISRTRWPVSVSASTGPGTPRTPAHECPVAVRSASSRASCPITPACSTSSIVTDRASGASCTGSRKVFLIIIASCLACSADRFISAAVSCTASTAALRSARSWSLPSTSTVSFLRPASASSPTSQAPRSSTTNTTLVVSGQRAPVRYFSAPQVPATPRPDRAFGDHGDPDEVQAVVADAGAESDRDDRRGRDRPGAEPCLSAPVRGAERVVITTLVAVPGPLFTAVGCKPPSSIPARRAQPRHSAGQSGSEALKPRPAAVCQPLF